MALVLQKLAALPKRALEAVVLKEAEARAKSYRPEQSEGVHQLWHAAVRRMRAARDLRNASNVAAAGTLYREAGVLTARAVALAAGESFADAAAWPRVRELAEQGALPRTPPSAFADGEPLDEAQDLAEQTDALLLDAVPPVVARQRLDRIGGRVACTADVADFGLSHGVVHLGVAAIGNGLSFVAYQGEWYVVPGGNTNATLA